MTSKGPDAVVADPLGIVSLRRMAGGIGFRMALRAGLIRISQGTVGVDGGWRGYGRITAFLGAGQCNAKIGLHVCAKN